ncbi:MAG TPA: hypothetical protein VK468_03660 [Pyrinomonadaceae bacterium]|nr:hypothetical protein [Pyrinomonadaceae bacterium]
MADENNKCGHGGCQCMVTGDKEFCSQRCEEAEDQDITEISCDCGHAGCAIV